VSELKVKLGIDDFLEREEFKGKRLGLLTNSTGINGRLKQNIDLIVSSGFNLVKLFGPEHGISGAAPDGVGVGNAVDPKYGIPVYSLFGEIYRPTEEMLSDLDFFVYDIQDVGLRFYTYIYSLAYSMEECARRGIKVIVLDRPNPLSCKVEGPTIKKGFETFVGGYGLALRYGLTVGELARYYNAAFNMERIWKSFRWKTTTGICTSMKRDTPGTPRRRTYLPSSMRCSTLASAFSKARTSLWAGERSIPSNTSVPPG
jgi:uncharacterized protein YbbC (DUF1343 family)